MSKANGGGSEASSSTAVAVQAYYQDEENLKKLCNFLRTKHGPAIREATLMEKRVYYLKGTGMLNFIIRKGIFVRFGREPQPFILRPVFNVC